MGIWLEGKTLAKTERQKVKEEIAELKKNRDEVPGLAAILVGENKASQIYVGTKERSCEKLGLHSEVLRYSESIKSSELKAHIADLNSRKDIDGILVQEPLPSHLNAHDITTVIRPEKDVDGFHPYNLGNILRNEPGIRPCTPLGIMRLLASANIGIEGKDVVIIGRSYIVGKPLAAMMTNAHGTVTTCHSRTKNLAGVAARADILVAAMGRGAFVTPDFVKEGAVVVDVGINQVTDIAQAKELFGDNEKREKQLEIKGYTLVGDVHPSVINKASYLTPVPKGVGPLTVAMLMRNTLEAFKTLRIPGYS